MKKLITVFLLFLFAGYFNANAQRAIQDNIERNLVLVEIGTGGWCYYCPGAAMGADDLVDNGHPVAIVENHNGDPYANTYSNARNNFYGVPGYPTAYFDGLLPVVGGSHTATMYNSYVPRVNTRMSVTTPFDIDFTYTDNGNNNFTATVDVSKVGDYSSEVVLLLFVTESNIAYNWQGQDHVNFVNRLMVPNQNGTPLDFSGGNDVVEELSFDLNSSWVRDECEIVVAIQNLSTKEVFNAAKISMLQATYDYDATVNNILFPLEEACALEVVPRIEIENQGGILLESVDIEYSVNDGDALIYTWEGALSFQQTEVVVLPAVSYDVGGTNTIEFNLSNPNGVEDENPDNNTIETEFTIAPETSNFIEMQLYTGTNGSEISWEFYNYNGDVVASGSEYGNNEVVEMVLPTEESGCFDFYLYDSGANGFSGGGYLKLYDDGLVFSYVTAELNDMLDIPFHVMNALAMPTEFTANANGYDVTFDWSAPSKAELLGYNIYEVSDLDTPINESLITENSYVYTLASNGAYEYYLAAVYDEGLSDLAGPVFVDLNVGIYNLNNSEFNIYPNPMSDFAQITFELKENAEVSYSIYSITGSLVSQSVAENKASGTQIIELNTHDLEEGIYFVNLNVNGENTTKKITVLK